MPEFTWLDVICMAVCAMVGGAAPGLVQNLWNRRR